MRRNIVSAVDKIIQIADPDDISIDLAGRETLIEVLSKCSQSGNDSLMKSPDFQREVGRMIEGRLTGAKQVFFEKITPQELASSIEKCIEKFTPKPAVDAKPVVHADAKPFFKR